MKEESNCVVATVVANDISKNKYSNFLLTRYNNKTAYILCLRSYVANIKLPNNHSCVFNMLNNLHLLLHKKKDKLTSEYNF